MVARPPNRHIGLFPPFRFGRTEGGDLIVFAQVIPPELGLGEEAEIHFVIPMSELEELRAHLDLPASAWETLAAKPPTPSAH